MLPIFALSSDEENKDEKKSSEKEADIYSSHPKELVDLICSSVDVDPKSVLDMDCYLYDMNVFFFSL